MSQKPNQSIFDQFAMPPGKPQFNFDFGKSFSYIFENPNWVTNTLFCALCLVVPVFGPLVLCGYQMEIVQCLHVTRGQRYPDFDLNILIDYLVRGLWFFLVGLVLSIIVVPICGLFVVLIFLSTSSIAAVGGGPTTLVLFLILPLLGLCLTAVSLLMGMVAIPMALQASLGLDFGAAFNVGFIKQFVGNVWKQMLLSALLFIPVSLLATFVGMLAFCVGIYFTFSLIQLMSAHLVWQYYELHLSKGGEPIPYRSVN